MALIPAFVHASPGSDADREGGSALAGRRREEASECLQEALDIYTERHGMPLAERP
jgi:hypothetical protein